MEMQSLKPLHIGAVKKKKTNKQRNTFIRGALRKMSIYIIIIIIIKKTRRQNYGNNNITIS